MGKRKVQKEAKQSLNAANGRISAIEREDHGEEEEEEVGGGEKGTKFFACYLLTSLCPRFKGHTYIGYTLNPRRRIRQHNGEIGSGAWRTKKKRPWEMVLCIYGFPTNVAALQFEWAWQHPVESLAVRSAAANFKSISGLANKIKLAYTMLTLPAWQSLSLTVNLFSTKYQTYTSGCPPLPERMQTQVDSMDELPCYNVNARANVEWDGNECEGSSQESTEEASKDAERHNDDFFPSCADGSCEENVHHQISQVDDACVNKADGSLENTRVSIEEDDGQCFIINDFSAVMQSPSVVEITTGFNKWFKTSANIVSDQVEIIDVFTPSPCNKKRRSTVCSEIIDLTNSPVFV